MAQDDEGEKNSARQAEKAALKRKQYHPRTARKCPTKRKDGQQKIQRYHRALTTDVSQKAGLKNTTTTKESRWTIHPSKKGVKRSDSLAKKKDTWTKTRATAWVSHSKNKNIGRFSRSGAAPGGRKTQPGSRRKIRRYGEQERLTVR